MVLVLASTGCPFVFGPPDLSKVDILVTDDDSGTTDGTTPTEDTDTGTIPSYDVPKVVDLELKRFVDKLGVAFSVVDTDQDLVSGRVTLMSNVEGATPLIYTIPGDLDVWEPLGRSVISIPQDWLPCEGLDESWTITLTDAAGHVGPSVDAELQINGLGLVGEAELYDFGWLEATTVACVEFNADSDLPNPIQEQLQLDREDLRFRAVTSGTYSFALSWQNVMDADLLLLDENALQIAPPTIQVGPAWEAYLQPLVADTIYTLSPKYYYLDGNTPPYLATLLMGPADE